MVPAAGPHTRFRAGTQGRTEVRRSRLTARKSKGIAGAANSVTAEPVSDSSRATAGR